MSDSLLRRPEFYIDRGEEERFIRRILDPSSSDVAEFFTFITGAPGAGKTTLVQRVLYQVRGGAVYMAAGSNPLQFPQQLADALQLIEPLPNPLQLVYSYVLHLYLEQERQSRLVTHMDDLETAARTFVQRRRRPVVLVIDDADLLAEADNDVWRAVMACSQRWADAGLVRVVFVSSDDAFVSRLLGNSRCSRAGAHEVGDLSDEQGAQLLARRGMPTRPAAAAVQAIGGRIIHLLDAATAAQRPGTCAVDMAMAAAEAQFQQAGLLDDTPQRAAGLAVLRLLAAAEDAAGISTDAWNDAVPSAQHKRALLQANVFALRHKHRRIVFENRAARVFAQRLLKRLDGAHGTS